MQVLSNKQPAETNKITYASPAASYTEIGPLVHTDVDHMDLDFQRTGVVAVKQTSTIGMWIFNIYKI